MNSQTWFDSQYEYQKISFSVPCFHTTRIQDLPETTVIYCSFSSFSAHSGVVLSVEEVEAGLKGLKVDQEGKIATPFLAEQMEESLNVTGSRPIKKDGDMTAFNKLVSSMKASGTLPSQPKVNVSSKHLALLNCAKTWVMNWRSLT